MAVHHFPASCLPPSLLQEIIQVLHNRIKATWDMHNK
jgi:hypothetical protein